MGEIIKLFLVFARIGAVTFGGGYAMLPILQREVVEKYHWATNDELTDYYAVGQCTPGVIAVNTATFVGSKRKRHSRWHFCYSWVWFLLLLLLSR
jgi:chromate transporter